MNESGRIYFIQENVQSCVVFMGLAVLKLDCDLLRMVVEVDTLFHNADVAATSSGF